LIDQDGEQAGIVSIQQALDMAEQAALDLVEISPNAEPPVCRIMNYGKFLYEKSKTAKEQKKKQKVVQVKEIKFRPGTDEGDYQVKLRSLIRFLEDGDKAKITVRFRGREMAHQDIGLDVLERVKNDLADISVVESAPGKLEGRQAMRGLTQKKKKKKKKKNPEGFFFFTLFTWICLYFSFFNASQPSFLPHSQAF